MRASRNQRQHLSHRAVAQRGGSRLRLQSRALQARRRTAGISSIPRSKRCRSGAGEQLWRPVFAALNLPLIAEFSAQYSRSALNEYLASAGMPACPLPIMAEREAARLADEARREQEELRRREAERLEGERARAELVAQRERQRTQQLRAFDKRSEAALGHAGSAPDAMMELQRRLDKSHEQGGKKNRD